MEVGSGELKMETVLVAAKAHGEYKHKLTLSSSGMCPHSTF
jgi:hypothetical protein